MYFIFIYFTNVLILDYATTPNPAPRMATPTEHHCHRLGHHQWQLPRHRHGPLQYHAGDRRAGIRDTFGRGLKMLGSYHLHNDNARSRRQRETNMASIAQRHYPSLCKRVFFFFYHLSAHSQTCEQPFINFIVHYYVVCRFWNKNTCKNKNWTCFLMLRIAWSSFFYLF